MDPKRHKEDGRAALIETIFHAARVEEQRCRVGSCN
jgi:hypothetical protein